MTERTLRRQMLEGNLVVTGGGLAGVCCAITAARQGLKVILIQDRPVLGGNASSEVRLWALGATSHMGNNNRWSREGGVINEILLENLYRNAEGNPVIFDTVILEKIIEESQITLLLNTAVFSVENETEARIKKVRAFCSQNVTLYEVSAPLFCDASGDGLVGYLAGAAYRMGAEPKTEFDEKFAPSEEYGSLMGHSIFFYSKDTGKPVRYIPPSFALKDITQIPRFRNLQKDDSGSRLWWLEYGGRLDTIHDTEAIKWELWKIVYGVWDYIKNSGRFEGVENMTLEWVGMIPGKRESRRFEGDYMLIQQDIIEQRPYYDAVSFGGWAIDLHPADGVYSAEPGCNQWHSKGVYQIPYRCLYSRNIENLFLAGRIISASHVANGSTRVMLTCAHNGQAAGMAAAICIQQQLLPRDLAEPGRISMLQQKLLKTGQYIPNMALNDAKDLATHAQITASSSFCLSHLPPDGPLYPLDHSVAMLLPIQAGKVPAFGFYVAAKEACELCCELRISSRKGSFTPDTIIATRQIVLSPNARTQYVETDFEIAMDEDCYVFVVLKANEHVSVQLSNTRVTGILAVHAEGHHRVNEGHVQIPNDDIGVDRMEFWIPRRWPEGHNLAMKITPPLECFKPSNVVNGVGRPVNAANAWAANLNDEYPCIRLKWECLQQIKSVELSFDTDWDHALESVLMGHPFHIAPFCVRQYRVRDAAGRVLHSTDRNHQAHNILVFDAPVATDELVIETEHPSAFIPAAIFEIHCYA